MRFIKGVFGDGYRRLQEWVLLRAVMGIIADGNGYCHKAARVMEIGYSLLNPFHPYVVSISMESVLTSLIAALLYESSPPP